MRSRFAISGGVAVAAIAFAFAATISAQDVAPPTTDLPLGTTYKDFRLESGPPSDPATGGNPVDTQAPPALAVPEPASTTLLLVAGAGALAVSYRRRRKS